MVDQSEKDAGSALMVEAIARHLADKYDDADSKYSAVSLLMDVAEWIRFYEQSGYKNPLPDLLKQKSTRQNNLFHLMHTHMHL